MKSLHWIFLFFAALLAGCSTWRLPPNSCDGATVGLQVGPFFSQHLTLTNISKDAAGNVVVGQWDGTTSYLGVLNFTQTAHNLHISAQPAPAPAAPSTGAKP